MSVDSAIRDVVGAAIDSRGRDTYVFREWAGEVIPESRFLWSESRFSGLLKGEFIEREGKLYKVKAFLHYSDADEVFSVFVKKVKKA